MSAQQRISRHVVRAARAPAPPRARALLPTPPRQQRAPVQRGEAPRTGLLQLMQRGAQKDAAPPQQQPLQERGPWQVLTQLSARAQQQQQVAPPARAPAARGGAATPSRFATQTAAARGGRPRRGEPEEAAGADDESEGGSEAIVLGAVAVAAAGGAAWLVATQGVDGATEAVRSALAEFTTLVKSLGPAGYVLYVAAYAGLEVLLLPATPVALTAGPLFGLGPGTALSALGGLTGACTCFLLGRTVARRRVLVWTEGSTVFRAIDRAIAKDGFRVVLLVNLSPLASIANLLNYAYGTTRLELAAFLPATAISIVPRTFATVQAGALGASSLDGEASGLGAFTLVAAVLATVYVTNVAKQELDALRAEEEN